jgi:hypothetical protein
MSKGSLRKHETLLKKKQVEDYIYEKITELIKSKGFKDNWTLSRWNLEKYVKIKRKKISNDLLVRIFPDIRSYGNDVNSKAVVDFLKEEFELNLWHLGIDEITDDPEPCFQGVSGFLVKFL